MAQKTTLTFTKPEMEAIALAMDLSYNYVRAYASVWDKHGRGTLAEVKRIERNLRKAFKKLSAYSNGHFNWSE